FPEVFPPSRCKFAPQTVPVCEKDSPAACDPPDLCNRNSRNARRDLSAGGRGEQQFVILASVQRKIEIDLAGRLAHLGSWESFCLKLRAHATFFADVRQVGRKTVTGIDHSRSQALLAQVTAQLDSRLGEEMSRIVPRIQL